MFAAILLALVLPTLGIRPEIARTIDDPPPEPVDCPLCGGNPALHVERTFAALGAGADAMVRVVRW